VTGARLPIAGTANPAKGEPSAQGGAGQGELGQAKGCLDEAGPACPAAASAPRVYSNRIARDMLPGVIKPLVWTVNTSIVNAAWIDLLEEVLGPLDLRPADLTRSFGYRAYFDVTTFGAIFERLGMPRDSLERMLGLPTGPDAPRMRMSRATLRHLPRLLPVARRTLSRGRWTRAELAEMGRQHDVLAAVDLGVLGEEVLLRRVDEVSALARRAAYANIIVPMTLLAYERTLWLEVRAAGLDPAAVDPAAGRSDRAAWDPNAGLDRLRALVETLPEAARADLAARRRAALDGNADLAPVAEALDAFVTRFGHLSGSNNDFSRPAWREDGDAVVDLVLAHPARSRTTGEVDRALVAARLPRYRRPAFRLLWRRTGAFHVYRNAVGAAWSRTYGLLRETFLALGDRFVSRAILDRPDDVFYLTLDEIRLLAANPAGGVAGQGVGPTDGDVRGLVARRRAEVAEAADLVVPEVVYGDAFVPRRRDEAAQGLLEGVPASRGTARGTARVIRDIDDFGRVAPGDVIVIPFSDVCWNPLFARAAGVVAEETGGILSHAAIVAREYGIPCVVGVAGACELIADGTPIVVDGTAGSIVLGAPAGS
jgi:phosphohistidine swiveling domain-containing protein